MLAYFLHPRLPPARRVLGDAQAEDAGLDEAADIAERAAALEPTRRAAGSVKPGNHGTVGPLDAPMPIDRDAAYRIGDAGADWDSEERRRVERTRLAAS